MNDAPEVYERLAVTVADDVLRLFREPPLDPAPVVADAYPHLDLRWYRDATAQLEAQGYRKVADLDGARSVAPGTPPPLVRVFLSPDGAVGVALYHVKPRSPGLLAKAVLWLLGKWPKGARVVEALTYLDERALSTSNQGDLNHFEAPPWVARESLPVDTTVSQVVTRHQARLATEPVPPHRFRDFSGLNSLRNQHLERAAAWRARVGLLPSELDRMLAPHGEFGVKLRPFVEREVARRLAAWRGASRVNEG